VTWTRSVHLSQWADTLDARGQLPLLIRNLVRRTVPALQSSDFPAWEQTYRPGFDGVVETVQGNQYVPNGRSGWELGVDKDPKAKADEDFQKRCEEKSAEEQKQLAFVFVTPRAWLKKDKWAKEKAAKSSWREVRVLDVNDLEQWLELAPDVDIRFARLAGHATLGVQDLGSYWSAVRSISSHPLTPSVFTALREDEASSVARWLGDAPSSFFMRTSGLTDGLDFLAALTETDERLPHAIIVYTVDAWRAFGVKSLSLVLIAAPSLELAASDVAEAVEAGHYVFLSGPRGNVAASPTETLRRQAYHSVSEALIESGFSEAKANSLARACCGSSSILKRLITRHPDTVFPPWGQDDVRTALAPFALVGGWTHVDPKPPRQDLELPRFDSEPPIDVLVVSELVGCKPNDLDAYLTRWQMGPEPLFVKFGASVFVASREDAWHLLGEAVSQEQLRRFEDLAVLVLEEDNPAFELEPDQRWMANLYGKRHSISEDLRRSLVESLALIATYPTANSFLRSGKFETTVRSVLDKTLLPNAKWQRWASFGQSLTILAEADPEFFLRRVEADLASSHPELPKLFQDKSSSFFSGGALHTDLLWALEGLAWSPSYLQRVAVCLAKLAAYDPGGSYANRPVNSLQEIFLLWLPHTTAPIAERLAALEAIINTEPAVGWALVKALLPSGITSFSHNTHLPRWRPWAVGWNRHVVADNAADYAAAVADMTLRHVGTIAANWSKVIGGLLRFGPHISERVLSALEATASVVDAGEKSTVALWTKLRKLVARHERYADASWAFPATVRERLALICERLTPADLLLKNRWLFTYRAELPGFDIVADHIAHDHALYEARLTALKEIIDQNGAKAVGRLLEAGGDGTIIGSVIGRNDVLGWRDAGLPDILESTGEEWAAFANGYVWGRFFASGWSFINGLPLSDWSASQIATLAILVGFRRDVWTWLESFGQNVRDVYWLAVPPFLHPWTLDLVEIATTEFLRVGRGFAACRVLNAALHDKITLASDRIATVLEMAASSQNTEAKPVGGDPRHAVQELVKHLQDDQTIDHVRLASIEWRYLAWLDPHFDLVGPDTLTRTLQSEPLFFVELLKTVYRARHEAPRDEQLSETDQLKGRQAHRLLDTLSTLPGKRDDGMIDYTYLKNWLEEVRRQAKACDRIEVCDLALGGVIARSTKQSEGYWPPTEVGAIMEDTKSDDLFRGFVHGVLNARGIVARSPFDGGDLERRLAANFKDLGDHARMTSPRLADAFSDLARHYEAYARHEDVSAERDRLGR
jgi:hypothetical protein